MSIAGAPKQEVVALVRNASLVSDRFGVWPSFADAEIAQLRFCRGNFMATGATGNWDGFIKPSLIADFVVFEDRWPRARAGRQSALVTLEFAGLVRVSMDGFNHQNPIVDLGIELRHEEALRKEVFQVDWGRTAVSHDVSLTCEAISVLAVKGAA